MLKQAALGLALSFGLSPRVMARQAPNPLLAKLQSENQRLHELWDKKDFEGAFKDLMAIESSSDFPLLSSDLRAGIHYSMACAKSRLQRKPEALAYLGMAVGEGFRDWSTFSTDSDLDLIRKEPGFRILSSAVQERGDHLTILRRFSAYSSDPGPNPAFTYETPDAPELVTFRETYHLRDIAGVGTSFEKGARLMRWLHAKIRHDGNSMNPQPMNGPNLLEACADGKRGLNCFGLAVILQEACLSVGVKARMVRCWPLDPNDPDCHVINAIWSQDLGKWVLLDPTNDLWVMDEKGVPLSIQEFRDRLIEGKPVRLSEGANWNGEPKVPSEYFDYMAKNLVRIACPLSSSFGYNSRAKGEMPYVTLDSTALDRPTYERSGGVTVKNPAVFWAKP